MTTETMGAIDAPATDVTSVVNAEPAAGNDRTAQKPRNPRGTKPAAAAHEAVGIEDLPHNAQLAQVRQAAETGGSVPIAFRDRDTDSYFVGEINPKERTHTLHRIGGKGRVNDWLRQHGRPALDVVPTYQYRFEPETTAVFDADREPPFINRYVPSEYRRKARARKGTQVPPTIKRVIRHVVGNDKAAYERLLNTLAVIFQTGARSETGWILQGTTGTGKGVLVREIIRPLIGPRYCKEVTLANLEDKANAFMEESIVLFIDEVDTDQVRSSATLIARLKSLITEDTVPLRAMRQDLREVANHLNLILASNQPNAMRIETDDRRFNVAPRQEQKLLKPREDGEKLVAKVRQELPQFANYLMTRKADRRLARQALDNEAKRSLQAVTQSPIEEVATALLDGALGYFVEMQPDGVPDDKLARVRFDGGTVVLADIYREFLAAAKQAAADGRKHVVPHRQLFAVFELLAGGMPQTKGRLAQLLGRHRIEIKPHTVGGKSMRGFGASWTASAKKAGSAGRKRQAAQDAAA